jgi:hypothetical protein
MLEKIYWPFWSFVCAVDLGLAILSGVTLTKCRYLVMVHHFRSCNTQEGLPY